MRFLVWAFRALVVLVVLRFLLRLFNTRRAPQPRAKSRPQERLGGTLVRCATCGTHVPQDRALTTGAGEAATFFCSAACQHAVPRHAGT